MSNARFVGVQRLDEQIDEESAAAMKQADDLRHREAAPEFLTTRLAEGILQLGRVGH